MKITARGLSWGPDRSTTVLRDVDLEIDDGQTVGLVGPNGAGKSSLLRLLAGLRTPRTGRVRYDGTDVCRLPPRRRARAVAFVEQNAALTTEMTAGDIVALGRIPHRRAGAADDAADRDAIGSALAETGVEDLRHRRWNQLSGGERQRVQLARALAQRADCLILDEPTNHLDIRHQLDILHLAARSSATCVIAVHDLGHAARYCDRIVLLERGGVAAAGAPEEVLTAPAIRRVFGVRAVLHRLTADTAPLLELSRLGGRRR